MITVIIPLYNKAHTIKDTLNTVLNQTYSEYEIIIMMVLQITEFK